MKDIYREVTDRILAEMQAGTMPWVKPWSSRAGAGNGMPCNAVTGRAYSGVNVVLTWMEAQKRGWDTLRFLTFKQAKEAGGTVRAGEHGFKIVFMKKLLVKDKSPKAKEDDEKLIPMLREFTVFHVSQCDGLPDRVVNGGVPLRVRNKDGRDELADEFVKATGAKIREGAGEAMYVPSQDMIFVPAFEAFNDADSFYGTTFHELTHWTKQPSRCDRQFSKRFGDASYAAEELVAELGAAFMAAEFGFDGVSQSAAYVANWIQLLKDDKKAVFTAASAAQKAVDFLRGQVLAEEAVAA